MKAFRIPITVPEQSNNGAVEPMLATQSTLQFSVHDGFSALEGALGNSMVSPECRSNLVGANP